MKRSLHTVTKNDRGREHREVPEWRFYTLNFPLDLFVLISGIFFFWLDRWADDSAS